jgi:hypothetical protein
MERIAFTAVEATPQAACEARRFVREALADSARHAIPLDSFTDAAVLVATELVEDAVANHAAIVHLRTSCRHRHLRVEILDSGRTSHVPVDPAGREAGAYRRRIIDGFADRWSTTSIGDGQFSWFELGERPEHRRDRAAATGAPGGSGGHGGDSGPRRG